MANGSKVQFVRVGYGFRVLRDGAAVGRLVSYEARCLLGAADFGPALRWTVETSAGRQVGDCENLADARRVARAGL